MKFVQSGSNHAAYQEKIAQKDSIPVNNNVDILLNLSVLWLKIGTHLNDCCHVLALDRRQEHAGLVVLWSF
jgi:hypothetical protein